MKCNAKTIKKFEKFCEEENYNIQNVMGIEMYAYICKEWLLSNKFVWSMWTQKDYITIDIKKADSVYSIMTKTLCHCEGTSELEVLIKTIEWIKDNQLTINKESFVSMLPNRFF